MPKFSQTSISALSNAHPDIQRVMNAAIQDCDFAVLESCRDAEHQKAAFEKGSSCAKFGQSPHNFQPALAVDCVPYPIDWKNTKAFQQMAQVINGHALRLGVAITWGGTFKTLRDMPHFELSNWRSMIPKQALVA